MVDNTYEARLKRLKEELNGPTVTEIIQMHKLREKNQTFDMNEKRADHIEEAPAQLQTNFTLNPSYSNEMPLETQSFDRDR